MQPRSKSAATSWRKLIGVPRRDDPNSLRKALRIVAALEAAELSDYPRGILFGMRTQFERWYDHQWRGNEAQSRSDLMLDLAEFEASWERID